MEATSNLGAIVAWSGFALAFIFGAVGNKVNFCTMGSVADIVNMGDWGRMRMWLLAIAVAIIGSHTLQLLGLVDLSKSIYQFSSVVPPMSLPMVQVERQGRVVGSAIIWDQRKFKQVVVRGYSRAMERWRWLLRLPAVGTALPLVYLSHFAVPAHDPNVCVELVDTGLAAARAMGCRWLVLGLTARHPLAPVVQWRYRPRRYESRLYVVHEPGTRVQLDGRIPHVEVALL